ncbi:PKD domain-containing protein [bacterium]|nr:PKD domain-containing protein [bacterium]
MAKLQPGAVIPHKRSNPFGTPGSVRGLLGTWQFYRDGGPVAIRGKYRVITFVFKRIHTTKNQVFSLKERKTHRMKRIESKRHAISIWLMIAVAAMVVAFVATSALAQDYPSGMITYWKFDEGSGTIAYDSVNDYDGAINGATWSTGVVGNSLSFNGSSDYVAFSTDEFVNTSDSFSYSVWLKFNHVINGTCSGPDYEYERMIVSVNNGPYLYLGSSGRMVAMTLANDDSWLILKTNRCSWSEDTWYHIAVTLDSSKMKIYVNGSLENEIPGGLKGLSGDSFNLKLGKMHYIDSFYFYGSMDELAVFDRALSAGEIQQHFQNGLIGLGYEEEPPVADAGSDQSVDTNATVTLDGSGSSDPNNLLPLTYEWAQTGGLAVTFTPTLSVTTFTAPSDPTVLTFTLNVTNSLGLPSVPDTVVITVTNQQPVADAGLDQSVYTNAPVTLDGSGSSDPDGDLPLTYGWTQTGGPAITLSSQTFVSPTFTAPSDPVELTFTLVVTDSLGLATLTSDEVVITVQPYHVYIPLVIR